MAENDLNSNSILEHMRTKTKVTYGFLGGMSFLFGVYMLVVAFTQSQSRTILGIGFAAAVFGLILFWHGQKK